MVIFRKNKTQKAERPNSIQTKMVGASSMVATSPSVAKKKLSSRKSLTLAECGSMILSVLATEKEIVQAVFFIYDSSGENPSLNFLSGYACNAGYPTETSFEPGEGLPGQALKSRKILNLRNIPKGFIKIKTGLGEAYPQSLLLIPLFFKDQPVGVIELASFREFNAADEAFFTEIADEIAEKLQSHLKTTSKS